MWVLRVEKYERGQLRTTQPSGRVEVAPPTGVQNEGGTKTLLESDEVYPEPGPGAGRRGGPGWSSGRPYGGRLLARASSCSSPSRCLSSRSFCRIRREALVWTKRR